MEIFLSGVWGTISDDFASSTDARIVCRQLGYSTYSEFIIPHTTVSTVYRGIISYSMESV